MILCTS